MFCENCGAAMREHAKSCPECGLADGAVVDRGGAAGENSVRLSWTAYITPFRNLYVVRQFFQVMLATLVIVAGLMSAVSGQVYLSIVVAAVGVGIITALLPVGALIHLLAVGGKELYIITDQGVWRGPAKRAPEAISGTFSAMGAAALLRGDLSAAGLSMLAAGRVQESLAWRDVKEVIYKPNWRLIIIKKNRMTTISMFCTNDNYAEVERLVRYYRPGY